MDAPSSPGDLGLEARVVRLEQVLLELSQEVRTQRLTLAGSDGREALVALIDGDAVELRVLAPGARPGGTTGIVCYATGDAAEPAMGVELWADGDAIAGATAVRDTDGTWRVAWFNDQPSSDRAGGAEC